eukprot:804033_1
MQNIFNIDLQSTRSMILSSPGTLPNNGIFALRNSKWGRDFLNKWIYVTEHASTFKLLQVGNIGANKRDQNIFDAILAGFDPYSMNDTQFRKYLYLISESNEMLKEHNFIYNAKQHRYLNADVHEKRTDDIVILHFSGSRKYPTEKRFPGVFYPFKHAMESCYDYYITTVT